MQPHLGKLSRLWTPQEPEFQVERLCAGAPGKEQSGGER